MTKIVPELERLSHNLDNNVLTALLGQFEYISKVLEYFIDTYQLYFENNYESGIKFITDTLFPILDRVLIENQEVPILACFHLQVQASAIDAFVKCCRFLNREDQGVHTYMYIVKVRLLCITRMLITSLLTARIENDECQHVNYSKPLLASLVPKSLVDLESPSCCSQPKTMLFMFANMQFQHLDLFHANLTPSLQRREFTIAF